MSILVIGGTGTIGTHLVEELVGRDIPVTILVHKTRAKHRDGVTQVKGDTTDTDSMREATRGMTTLFMTCLTS